MSSGGGKKNYMDRDGADYAGLHVIDHVKADFSVLSEMMSGVCYISFFHVENVWF